MNRADFRYKDEERRLIGNLRMYLRTTWLWKRLCVDYRNVSPRYFRKIILKLDKLGIENSWLRTEEYWKDIEESFNILVEYYKNI